MREIKFKVWLTSTKQMCYPQTLEEIAIGVPLPLNAICLQYTGLKDRNGKEIYEGDIITFGPSARKVEFDSGAFWAGGYLVSGLFDPEIIGNIYEHPNLLGGETHAK